MTLHAIEAAAREYGLLVMGHTEQRVLLGTDAGWWDVFTLSSEYRDGLSNPIDRWSKQVIGSLAKVFSGTAVFPSDGPPYAPFIAWALATGRFWQSPTGMLVHDVAGLMISIRGALVLETPLPSPSKVPSPCDSCAEQPCTSACPVGALSAEIAYDVPRCKGHLSTAEGQTTCMAKGCEVRRRCPISDAFNRPEAQSALHMKAFMG